MRIATVVVAAVLSFASLSAAAGTAALRLVALNDDGKGFKGTAVHIGGGRHLTAAHAVTGMTSIWLVAIDGTRKTASLLWADPSLDVALLRSDAPATIAPISCAVPDIGSPIEITGFPAGNEPVRTKGTVASGLIGGRFRLADVAVAAGMSGGPVANQAGIVVGIASAMWRNSNGLSVFVPMSAICVLLIQPPAIE